MAPKLLFAYAYILFAIARIKGFAAGRVPSRLGAIGLAALFWNPFAWVELAFYGHFDILVGLACLGAVRARVHGRDIRAGACLAAGVLLKFLPIVLLPFLAFDRGRPRVRLLYVTLATIAIGLGLSVQVWGLSTFSPLGLAASRGSRTLSIFYFLRARYSPLPWIGVWPNVDYLEPLVQILALSLVWWWSWNRRPGVEASAVVAVATVVLLYRVGYPQYPMVTLVLASAWILGQWDRLRNRAALVVAMAGYFGWLAAFDVYYMFYEAWHIQSLWYVVNDLAGLPTFLLGCAFVAATVLAATPSRDSGIRYDGAIDRVRIASGTGQRDAHEPSRDGRTGRPGTRGVGRHRRMRTATDRADAGAFELLGVGAAAAAAARPASALPSRAGRPRRAARSDRGEQRLRPRPVSCDAVQARQHRRLAGELDPWVGHAPRRRTRRDSRRDRPRAPSFPRTPRGCTRRRDPGPQRRRAGPVLPGPPGRCRLAPGGISDRGHLPRDAPRRLRLGRRASDRFLRRSRPGRARINAWITARTGGKVAGTVPPDAVAPPTRMVLTSALYFRGNWADAFDGDRTRDAPFRVSASETVAVPMMHQHPSTKAHGYADLGSYQVLSLSCGQGAYAMVVLLPKRVDGLADLEAAISPEALEAIWPRLIFPDEMDISLPRFRLRASRSVKPVLETLGISRAFDRSRADFSGINGQSNDLFLAAATHDTFLDVHEEGIEAASATEYIAADSFEDQPPVFVADHPFVYVLRDARSGCIVFMGRVVNPVEAPHP